MNKIFGPDKSSETSGGEGQNAEQGNNQVVKLDNTKRLALVEPELPPYFVSQFEKNPRGWIWDILLGLYIIGVIAFVVFLELKS